MATINDPSIQEVMDKIGKQVRLLRESNTQRSYSDFAKNVIQMNKNTYFNIEQGKRDYTISHLLRILNQYPDMKISQFFQEAGL